MLGHISQTLSVEFDPSIASTPGTSDGFVELGTQGIKDSATHKVGFRLIGEVPEDMDVHKLGKSVASAIDEALSDVKWTLGTRSVSLAQRDSK